MATFTALTKNFPPSNTKIAGLAWPNFYPAKFHVYGSRQNTYNKNANFDHVCANLYNAPPCGL
jgi:hypothetical protein